MAADLEKRVRLALATSLTAMMIAVVPAAATEDADPAAVQQDVQHYARLYGLDEEVARDQMKLELEAGALDDTLTTTEAGTFAGLWIRHSPTFRVVVRFTEHRSGTIARHLTSTSLAGVVEEASAVVSLAELESELARFRSVEPTVPFNASINVTENRVDIYVASPAAFNDFLSRTNAAPPAHSAITYVPGLGGPASDIYGGLPITGCTAGFGIRKNGATTRGIVTAGHCGNTQSYAGSSLPYQSGLYSGADDEQWHTAPAFTVRNRIRYASDGSTRSITSRVGRDSTAVGTTLCKYGTTTGYDCGTVVSKTFTPGWVPYALPYYMQVHNCCGSDLSTGGDSGGPVFWNNAAYGIIEGWYGTEAASDLIYTAINFVEAGIGIVVLTS